jgi:hypothetical protein
MSKETIYDATIEFQDEGTAVINGLKEEQYLQLQAMLKLIEHKTPYYVTGRSPARTNSGGRLNGLWGRINSWMALLLLLSLLSPAVLCQELRPRTVEPLRVSIKAPQDEANEEMVKALRDGLRELRDIVITERAPAFEIQLNSMPVTSGTCRGFAVAVLVVNHKSGLQDLSVYVAADLKDLSKFVVDSVDQEYFSPSRERAFMKGK